MNETLKILREQNNYSQNSIATFLGISRQMYIKYEQGTIEPPVKIVKDLANFYRVPYDFIIDNKLNLEYQQKNNEEISENIKNNDDIEFSEKPKKKAVYSINHEEGLLSVASPTATPALSMQNQTSTYLQTILNMLPKLIFSEKLQVLSKLCDMVKTQTEENKQPSKKMQAYQKLLALNEELHLKSDGTKWTREELHERH